MTKHMRYDAKRDGNEKEIVTALTKAGCTVSRISEPGFPDLAVGRAGVNYLLEVKDPEQPVCNQHLKPKQVTWHSWWAGQKAVVKTVGEALEAVGVESNQV